MTEADVFPGKAPAFGLLRAALMAGFMAVFMAWQFAAVPARAAQLETAVFAGGCFWCMEQAFDEIEGVVDITAGFTGGQAPDPSYKQVSAGGTGHAEAIEVKFDPARVSFERLLDTYWRNVDPFDAGGQFCDRGESYRTEIFAASKAQAEVAENSKEQVAKRFSKPVATRIARFSRFYAAEDGHQDYYKRNPLKYKFYKWNCGRAQRLEEIWGKPGS